MKAESEVRAAPGAVRVIKCSARGVRQRGKRGMRRVQRRREKWQDRDTHPPAPCHLTITQVL